MTEQPQEDKESQSFSDRVQEICSRCALDVESIVQENEVKIIQLEEMSAQNALFYEETLKLVLHREEKLINDKFELTRKPLLSSGMTESFEIR